MAIIYKLLTGFFMIGLIDRINDWRFCAAIALLTISTVWAVVSNAAFPIPTECARIFIACLLCTLTITHCYRQYRKTLITLILLAWILINLYDADWLSVLMVNFDELGRWSPIHTPSNDYWVFYHGARDLYIFNSSPYVVSNQFPIPTYWLIHLLSGFGSLSIHHAGVVFWIFNLVVLAAVVIGTWSLLQLPSPGLIGALLAGIILTSNPVIASVCMGQTIILALGVWLLGIVFWQKCTHPWREIGSAICFVLAGMIKPPLMFFVIAFIIRALVESSTVITRKRRELSSVGRLGWWSLAFILIFIFTAIILPRGVSLETFIQFIERAQWTQVEVGKGLVFNFSLSRILLLKLDKLGILSFEEWLEPASLFLVLLGGIFFAMRIGRTPNSFCDLAPGLLIPPFVFGFFEYYYAAWFLPFLLWCGWLTLNESIPPRGQAIAWLGLALIQVFSSPLFLVGVLLLLLAGDYARTETSIIQMNSLHSMRNEPLS
jgi:hypothetical protein